MSAKEELTELFLGKQLRGEGAQADNIPDRRRLSESLTRVQGPRVPA